MLCQVRGGSLRRVCCNKRSGVVLHIFTVRGCVPLATPLAPCLCRPRVSSYKTVAGKKEVQATPVKFHFWYSAADGHVHVSVQCFVERVGGGKPKFSVPAAAPKKKRVTGGKVRTLVKSQRTPVVVVAGAGARAVERSLESAYAAPVLTLQGESSLEAAATNAAAARTVLLSNKKWARSVWSRSKTTSA